MKILVTGGAGFIGSHCVDGLLSQGIDVVVVDNFVSGREGNLQAAKALAKVSGAQLKVIRGDISRPGTWDKLPRCDGLIHFAAQTSVTASVQNPKLDFKTNVGSALHLVGWIQKHKVKFFLYANTAGALYGEARTLPTTEDSPLQPMAPYGATKAFTESYISSLAISLKTDGVWANDPASPTYFSWASLRLANVYGPRQYPKGEAGVIPIFVEEFAAGRCPTVFGDGNKTRDYIHVKDVAAAFLAAVEIIQKNPIDEAFNIGTGIATADIEVFRAVLKAAKLRWPVKFTEPHFLPTRPGEVQNSQPNPKRAADKLKWKARHDFSSGVAETVKFYELD